MTIPELQEVIAAKGFKLEIRTEPEVDIPTLWAIKPLSVQHHYLGTQSSLLNEPLAHFLQSWRYQEIGQTREQVVEAFVTEWIESVQKDYVYEGNRENLRGRVLRLYDDLRRADW
jgi:hypothetical protein